MRKPLALVSKTLSIISISCWASFADATTATVAELDASKARLTSAYNVLAGGLAPEDLSRLELAQKTWGSYRDAACAYQYRLAPEQTACLAEMNLTRAAWLEDQRRIGDPPSKEAAEPDWKRGGR